MMDQPGIRTLGWLATTAIALALAGPASAAAAAGAASEGAVLDELVVTAQKRTERLQDVPLPVSALSGATAEAQGARGFDTLAGKVPGLQVFGISRESMQISLRGVITDRAARTPQTAGIYLDEVPIGLASANPNFQQLDLDRVEVLRGPQGTLFGAGAEAGAVRLITAKPRFDGFAWGGGAEASGTRYGGGNSSIYAIVNAPAPDGEFAVRALGYAREESGYIDNTRLGVRNTNRFTINGGRLAATFKPDDKLSITAMIAAQDISSPDSDYVNAASGRYIETSSVLQRVEAKNRVYSVTGDYDFGPVRLTSVTSYQDTNSFRLIDASRYPFLLGGPAGAFTNAAFPTAFFQNGWTQELRLTSPDDARLTWIAGAFYSDIESGTSQSFLVPGFEAAAPTQPPASTFGLQKDNLYAGIQDATTKQYAAFVDGSYKVTDKLKVSAGVRYYNYDQDGLIDYNGLLQGRHDSLRARVKEDGFNPRFNVSYALDADKLVYAQAAKGFRIGGLNEPVPAGICGADLLASGFTTPPAGFKSDSLWNYEAGVKTAWANRRVTFNAAVFDVEWNDIQVTKKLACGYAVIVNGGKLRSRGLELESAAELLPGLTLSGSASYTDAQIVETSSVAGLGTAVGQRAPYQPKLAYNVSLEYRRPVTDKYDGFGAVDFSHNGTRYTDFNRASAATFKMPEYDVVNLRLGVAHADWQAFLFADNVNNAYGILDITRRGGSLPVYNSATPIRPRTIGLRLVKTVD